MIQYVSVGELDFRYWKYIVSFMLYDDVNIISQHDDHHMTKYTLFYDIWYH